ncbi:hypothetical protein LB504_007387 [Fusarium proliferatum]|nr:hypothetical protein LB504_007387 [Fusarium proliferatum]
MTMLRRPTTLSTAASALTWPNMASIQISSPPKPVHSASTTSAWSCMALEEAVWAREKWQEIICGKPFLIKGIQRVYDAERQLILVLRVLSLLGGRLMGRLEVLMLWSIWLTVGSQLWIN